MQLIIFSLEFEIRVHYKNSKTFFVRQVKIRALTVNMKKVNNTIFLRILIKNEKNQIKVTVIIKKFQNKIN